MAATLTVELEGAIIQTLPLEAPSLTIGRLPDSDLALPHPLVSRRHATLHLEGGQLALTDAGSTNGTFVGGERLLPNQPRVLAPGESFRIGPFSVTYQAAGAEEAPGEPEVTPVVSAEAAPVEPPAGLGAPPAPAEPPGGAEVPAEPPPLAAQPEEPAVAPPAEPLPAGEADSPPEQAEEGPAPEPPAEPIAAAEPAPAEPRDGGSPTLPPPPATEPPRPIPPAGPDGAATPGPDEAATPGPNGAVTPEPDGHVPAGLAAAPEPDGRPPEPIALLGHLPALGSLTALAPARPRSPAPLPRGPVSAYLDALPAIYQDGDFLGRFLLIFESIWEPLEQRQDHLALYFDPRTCPAGFLPWLGSWLEFSVNPHWPEARLRRLLSEAMDLYRWRGTRYGLTRLIELCTGLTPVVSEPAETPFVFHVALRLPPDSPVSRELVEQLVQAHKPAHAGYVLELGT